MPTINWSLLHLPWMEGVTRDFIIILAKEHKQFGSGASHDDASAYDLIKEGLVVEMFGPIKEINYLDKDIRVSLDLKDPNSQANSYTLR